MAIKLASMTNKYSKKEIGPEMYKEAIEYLKQNPNDKLILACDYVCRNMSVDEFKVYIKILSDLIKIHYPNIYIKGDRVITMFGLNPKTTYADNIFLLDLAIKKEKKEAASPTEGRIKFREWL